MKNKAIFVVVFVHFCLYSSLFAKGVGPVQEEYERTVDTVVRNKQFYKSGRLEAGLTAGAMPYDSLVNHYLLGGRLAWHLSDHFGWEIVDIQAVFPSVTAYTTDLVRDKGLADLETSQLRFAVGTNILLSPFYGKIHFFGSSVLYFDIYIVAGPGLVKAEELKVSTTATGVEPTSSVIRSALDPMATLGFGFKIFVNDLLGIVIDMRDYVIFTKIYDKTQVKSNFSVFGGVVFFIPKFG